MLSLWSLIVALTALLSYAVDATPISLLGAAQAEDESQEHGRSLLASCRTAPFAQCGGRGMNGPRDGVWRCCPSGYYCKQSDKWWWSCQKGSSKVVRKPTKKKSAPKRKKKSTPKRKKKSAPKKKKKKSAPKKKKKKSAPKKKKKKSSSKRRSNRRTSIGGSSYQNPQEVTSGGPCDKIDKDMIPKSHWCKLKKVSGRPKSGTPGVKLGRSTVYNGPLWTQIGHCGKRIWPVESGQPINDGGSEQKYVKVAMSSNWMGNWKEPNCGRKLCIRIIGYDEYSNSQPPSYWRESVGITMPGIVWDLCPECDDDHIDLLAAYPFSRAKVDQWNPYGDDHNRIWDDSRYPKYMNLDHVYGVGIWKVEWGWNDDGSNCDTYF